MSRRQGPVQLFKQLRQIPAEELERPAGAAALVEGGQF
jgi:hypothetical protein